MYFHRSDGRYLLSGAASEEIQSKYELTETQSYMNGKRRPDGRKNVYRDVNQLLSGIKLSHLIYEVECSVMSAR